MSPTYAIYAVSDDDQPVIDAIARMSEFDGVPDAVCDAGDTVIWTVPGRRVALWRDDYAEPDISTQPVRQIFLWGGGCTTIQVGLDVIDALRAHGIPVIVDPENPDLIAADAQRA